MGAGELGVLRTSCSAPTDHTERVTLTQWRVFVCVSVFLNTKAEEEEKRGEIVNNSNFKKTKKTSLIALSPLGPAHCATFFLLKTQRERVLIYFITFYERSFYSTWNSSEDETKHLVALLGPYFCINLLS